MIAEAGDKPKTILFGTNYKTGQTGEFAYIALKRMGHDIIPFTPEPDAPEDWIKVDSQADAVALVKSLAKTPDLFLMVESSTGSPFLPTRIPELEIPTAIWLYDNYLNFRWNKEVALLFDYCFFAQVNRINLAARYGVDNLTWLPFAADEKFHRNFHLPRDIDIGYLGTITGQKKKYFEAFSRSGLEVKTNDRFLSYEEIGRFYSRCKLVYNILARRDMNVRTFEASLGGALVVNQSWIDDGCRMIFREGENMAFHNFDDAPDICRALLADDHKREMMAANAEKLVMSEHTYRHRMQKVLDTCKGGITEKRMRRRSSFLIHVAEAMTCQHPHFRWRKRAFNKLEMALRESIVKTFAYLVKYSWRRIAEKAEKIIWSFGKAPV